MEVKDFLGLSIMSSPSEEAVEGGKHSVHMRGSGTRWSFPNKVSALPHFMPYKTVQEERAKKALSEHLASSVFMPVSTTDSLDANQKTFNELVQSNGFTIDRSIAAIPVQQFDGHRTHRAPEEGMFYANNSFFKTHGMASRNSLAPTIRKQSVAGFADQRNLSNPTAACPQLTLFYGGSVSVFDDISPEKAKAIMYLAGNMASANSNTTSPRTQMQDSNSRTLVADGYHGNQSRTMSQANAPSGNGSNVTDGLLVQPNSAFPSGSFPATMVASAVPQARKASLARFLEKRKERAMNSMPYNLSLKSPDCNTTPGPKDLN